MRHVIVRYKLKPEYVDEHLVLIAAVFAEIAETRPTGLRYAAMRAPDGLNFTHISAMEGPGNPLTALASFKAFIRDVDGRCDESPRATEATVLGDYGLFS